MELIEFIESIIMKVYISMYGRVFRERKFYKEMLIFGLHTYVCLGLVFLVDLHVGVRLCGYRDR